MNRTSKQPPATMVLYLTSRGVSIGLGELTAVDFFTGNAGPIGFEGPEACPRGASTARSLAYLEKPSQKDDVCRHNRFVAEYEQ